MSSNIKFIQREANLEKVCDIDFLNEDKAKEILNFHKSFPMYKETPLVEIKELSAHLGVKDIFVKDESHRFNLNAFKVLGGSYAVGKYLSDKLDMDMSSLTYEVLTSEETKEKQLGTCSGHCMGRL